ncbi:ABC transporter permease [Nonomuraea sp. B5E05]|uniref:ABC transporter permease n=1 Tax=Nonomuraea sp. B5E05 TaxID=3153569 RepID=UPI0032605E2D
MTEVSERAAPRRPGTANRSDVTAGLCFAFLAAICALALVPSMAPYDAMGANLTLGLSSPSESHWLGTDALGRDILSRVIVGARAALLGPLIVTLVSMTFGNALGLIAGCRGGWVDSVIMRWVDLMLALPGLLVAVVVIGALGGGYWVAVAVLGVLLVPFDARVIRGAALEQMPRPYVEAARTLGVPWWRLTLFHVWPNVSAVTVANTFLVFAMALVSLSGLSFLGFGADAGQPDWGLMIAENRTNLFENPASVVAPGCLLILTATCVNLLGDWVYQRLSERGLSR